MNISNPIVANAVAANRSSGVVAKNSQGDALSDAGDLLAKAIAYLRDATGYEFSGSASKEEKALAQRFDAKIKAVVAKLQPLAGEVEKLRKEADMNLW